MVISGKQKNDHYSWLIAKLTPRSKGSSVAQCLRSDELVFSLTVLPKYGKRKDILPAFHKCGKGIGDRIFTWRFLESWQPVIRSKYRYSQLSVKILDVGGDEMLSIHWNVTCPDGEPYQPHWHFHLDKDSYYLTKVHIPLDSCWGKVSPKSLDDYHKWVEGLLQFIEGEFANSLKRKRAS